MKWIDIAFKLLSIIVIPVVMWGFKLEIANVLQSERISELKLDVAELKDHVNASKDLDKGLAVVEGKLDATNTRLAEISLDLRRSLPPH